MIAASIFFMGLSSDPFDILIAFKIDLSLIKVSLLSILLLASGTDWFIQMIASSMMEWSCLRHSSWWCG
jgi:hypothetical protein